METLSSYHFYHFGDQGGADLLQSFTNTEPCSPPDPHTSPPRFSSTNLDLDSFKMIDDESSYVHNGARNAMRITMRQRVKR